MRLLFETLAALLLVEHKNNIEKIKQFLSIKKNDTLLINQVDEEIGSFYELAIEEMSKEIDIST